MIRLNNIKKITAVRMVAALATIIIMGPAFSSIGDVLAKQKGDDLE